MYLVLCLLALAPVAHSTCYGDLGEPVMRKEGDYIIAGMFNMGKLVTVGEGYDAHFECPPSSAYSIHRAISFAMTLDQVPMVGNATLGYEIYDTCASSFISRHVSTIIAQNDKVMGLIAPGMKDLVEASIASATSTIIPSIAYIFSDANLLEKTNYPSLLSLIETEEMEGASVIKMLQKLEFIHVDIWYHTFSEEAASYVYEEYVKKVGCGRLTEFSGNSNQRKLDKDYTMEGLMKSTYELKEVEAASVQVLMFNSATSTREFLTYVLTNSDNWQGWRGKTFIFGYSNGRRQYRDDYVDILTEATKDDYDLDQEDTENTFVFIQSEFLNRNLEEVREKLQYSDIPDNPNPLWQKFAAVTRCAKMADCDAKGKPRRALSSWVPFVVVGAKILAQMLEHTLEEYAEDQKPFPCIQAFREHLYKEITSGDHPYTIDVFGWELNNVRFNDSTLANGYTTESYRRSRNTSEIKYHTMGEMGYYTESLIDAEIAAIMPSERQKICSVSCQPGFYRLFSDIRKFPCCWVCKQCYSDQISNDTDSDTCMPCAVEETSVSNNTECAPVAEIYVESDSVFLLLGCSLAGLGVLLTVIVFLYINSKSSSPLMKASDLTFCNIYLLALFIGFIVGVCSILKPSTIVCRVEYFAVLVFVSLITSSLAFRCGKVGSLFTAVQNSRKPTVGFLFTDCAQFVFNIAVLLLNLGIGVVCVYYNAWQFAKQQQWPHKDIHLICFADNLYKAGGAFALPILMFLFTLCQSFKMRKFPHNFGETSNILMATTVVVMSCIMFFTGYKLSPNEIKSFLRSIIMFTTCLAYLACIFIPKIIVMLKNEDDQKMDRELMEMAVEAFSAKNAKKIESVDVDKAVDEAKAGFLTVPEAATASAI